ncbi:unnamed protein product [Ixodes persulcatus]
MPGSLRIAVVCSSNQNRSMEAHAFLSKKGFKVRSFGSGAQVKLPGSAPDKPNVYDFGVTYEQMYQDLMEKDKALYTQNGILHMLDRNRRIKSSPERFQNCYDKFDVIFTVEERVYDQVVEGEVRRLDGKRSTIPRPLTERERQVASSERPAFGTCSVPSATFLLAHALEVRKTPKRR